MNTVYNPYGDSDAAGIWNGTPPFTCPYPFHSYDTHESLYVTIQYNVSSDETIFLDVYLNGAFYTRYDVILAHTSTFQTIGVYIGDMTGVSTVDLRLENP